MKGRAREARKEPVDRIGGRLLESTNSKATEADSRPPQRLPSWVERAPRPRATAGRTDMEAPSLKRERRTAPQFLAPPPEQRAGGEKHDPAPRLIIAFRVGKNRIAHADHTVRRIGRHGGREMIE